ncbi:MAG TPA: MBL fold metallo-hydrolase [Nocardioides sp.]|nr:MBL fold metallo-hydrolase [Nocardioides sp.]
MERHGLSFSIGALALTLGLAGVVPATSAGSAPSAAPQAQARAGDQALRMAVRAVGGADALRGLRGFRYAATGQRWIFDEGVRPGDPAKPSAAFDQRVQYVVAGRRGPSMVRVDAVRTSAGADRPVHEVINGQRGFIRGVDANFSTSASKPMTADRGAAIREELALLNPHVLLLQALRNPRMARDGGRVVLGGQAFRVLVLRHAVAPVRLLISARTGRIARLRTFQHDYLRRDVRIEVRYSRWRAAGSGLRFPHAVALWSDGERLHRETRPPARLLANPRIARRAFRIPDSVRAARFGGRLTTVGRNTSEWVMSFANLGFIKDGGQTAINPTRIAPGVIQLAGVSNNSLVVRRASGIVVFEGALHDLRAEAVIRFIRNRFPGERITHVVSTHHHSDHAGGMRPYVALGARAVLHERAVSYFRQVFRERSSRIMPDRLDRTDRPARIVSVPAGGSRLLDDANQRVRVLPFPVDHSVDMAVAFAERGGVLFVSDVYTPGSPPGATGQALNDLIEANSLDVQWIAGGHGGFISYDDFLADLG